MSRAVSDYMTDNRSLLTCSEVVGPINGQVIHSRGDYFPFEMRFQYNSQPELPSRYGQEAPPKSPVSS